MDRLFKAFSQVDASTARRYGGTGLGLIISQRLSELMGGQMGVESEVGVGTTFHFTIQAQAAPSLARTHLHEIQPELRQRRLLIVDDNATNRLILTRQAQAWGMAYRATGQPAEALAWLRRGEQFDVAILDMHMPEMDGLTLALEIRRLEEGRGELGGREQQNSGEIQNQKSKLPMMWIGNLARDKSVQFGFNILRSTAIALAVIAFVLGVVP